MSSPLNLKIWEQRKKALLRVINRTKKDFDVPDNKKLNASVSKVSNDELNKIKNLRGKYLRLDNAEIHRLIANSEYHFERLFDYFIDCDPSTTNYPLNYILNMLTEHTANDLDHIRRAYMERKRIKGRMPAIFPLMIADMLTKFALRPAVRAGLVGGKPKDRDITNKRSLSVISYFNASIRIRILPYTDTVLIGIPFSMFGIINTFNEKHNPKLTISTDYLAIPHEVGHLIFHRGRVMQADQRTLISTLLTERLAETVGQSPNDLEESFWPTHWFEEVFADAYGCLIMGSICAEGLQYILKFGLPTNSSEHIAHHPMPALRPLMLKIILDRLYPENQEIHAGIEAAWQKWVKNNWQIEDVRTATYTIEGETLSGTEIIEAVTPLINVAIWGLQEWVGIDEEINKIHRDFWSIWEQREDGMISAVSLNQTLLDQLKPSDNHNIGQLTERLIGNKRDPRDVNDVIDDLLFRGWTDEQPHAGNVE